MKKLLYVALTLFCFACASDPQKEMEKAIVGEWLLPVHLSCQPSVARLLSSGQRQSRSYDSCTSS